MKAVSKFAAAGRRLRNGGGSGGGGLNGLSPQHVAAAAANNRLSPLPPHGVSVAQEQQLSLTGIFTPRSQAVELLPVFSI